MESTKERYDELNARTQCEMLSRLRRSMKGPMRTQNGRIDLPKLNLSASRAKNHRVYSNRPHFICFDDISVSGYFDSKHPHYHTVSLKTYYRLYYTYRNIAESTMAGTKKRKHLAEDSHSMQNVPSQTTMKAFASVRKSSEMDVGLKKRKTVHPKDATPVPVPIVSSGHKKRKRSAEEDISLDVASPKSNKTSKDIGTPRSKRTKHVEPLSPIETPSKSAMAMFNRLDLGTRAKPIPFALNGKHRAYDTPPDTPEADEDTIETWPSQLEDLARLNAAFLSALSLYYSHNGTCSPVNVKALLPMITKHWKQRAVSLEDLRLLLGLMQDSDATFELQDFGRAGVCLVKQQPRGRAPKRADSYVDEVDLNARFEDALKKRWIAWTAATPKENCEATRFVDQLPLATITKHDSVEKAALVFARGHQRLADLKASQASSTAESVHPAKLATEQKTTTSVQNRGTTLLDRILAKQALSASLPAGPTKEQLERKAALHRVEDVARVLDLLAAGRSRCSYSMPAMVQQLQQSLRSPMSKDEVVRCLSVMAEEITPGFVSLVKSGSVTGVVIMKAGKMGLEDLRQRVEAAVV